MLIYIKYNFIDGNNPNFDFFSRLPSIFNNVPCHHSGSFPFVIFIIDPNLNDKPFAGKYFSDLQS